MNNQEANVNKGFSEIYEQYDELEKSGIVVKWMRKRVQLHIEKYLKPNANILELNAGSGIDAIYFAKQGHQVLATDISDGFVRFTQEKIKENKLESKLRLKQISFVHLNEIDQKFDAVFSNFGGLNCIADLNEVLKHFDNLTHENAVISLVILPKHTPWEWLWFYKGFKKAFRRFGKQPVKANIEGHQIDVWYHNPKNVIDAIGEQFKLIEIENLGFFTPTGANDDFPLKFPKIFNFLIWLDRKFNFLMPKGVGDYYIISLQKK